MNKNYIEKIKSKLYGALREREKEGEWENLLDNLVIELSGHYLNEKNDNILSIINKLTICKYLSFKYYRKIIFDCMNSLDRLN